MALFLSPIGNEQQIDANGDPLNAGKIYSYLAGSTTPAATYTDNTGATAQANPIILNSLGLPSSPIWLTGGITYKFVIKDSADVTLRTVDNISGINDTTATQTEWVSSGFVPTFISTVSFSVPGDQTGTLQIGRRLRTQNTAGLIYSRITNSVFGATITTVTVVNDSGVLDSGLSSVSYGLAAPISPSLPNSVAVRDAMGITTARQNQEGIAYTTAGTSTAYTLTPSPAITAYAANQSFFVNFNAASGAAPTLAISAVATPPNLVKQIGDGTYANIAANDIPINHRSRVTLLSTTQALVEDLPIPARTLTSGTAVVSTSGTSIDFTGIPAWVKRVTISFNGVSTSGTSNPLFQIGDSGGVETSGYLGAGSTIDTGVSPVVANYTTGFGAPLGAATNVIHGSIVLSLINAATFLWAAAGTFGLSSTTTMALTSGSKALTATLDRVRITTVAGVDTFDAGSINILYE